MALMAAYASKLIHFLIDFPARSKIYYDEGITKLVHVSSHHVADVTSHAMLA